MLLKNLSLRLTHRDNHAWNTSTQKAQVKAPPWVQDQPGVEWHAVSENKTNKPRLMHSVSQWSSDLANIKYSNWHSRLYLCLFMWGTFSSLSLMLLKLNLSDAQNCCCCPLLLFLLRWGRLSLCILADLKLNYRDHGGLKLDSVSWVLRLKMSVTLFGINFLI